MFSPQQIQELLQILDKQNLIFISSKLGVEYLSDEEISRLQNFGINPFHLYKESNDVAKMSFHFGLLSDAIEKIESKQITLDDLKTYLESGKHIPLTKVEKNTIESIKKQYLGDIKANNGRIFQDINNIIGKNEKDNRKAYEAVIRGEIERGFLAKKSSLEIARDLARKTGDWNRNFTRIVAYISHQAFDEGRAAWIEDKYGEDALVAKNVYLGACKYCISAYLTGGVGSQPKIFKLSQLKANGSNIGRKVKDLKPVVGNHHVNCRCTLFFVDNQYSFNQKTQHFDIPKPNPPQPRLERPGRKPIRISVRGKEYIV